MGAEHVVGVVGGVVVVAAVVAVVLILRSGSIVPPVVLHPLCASCGHEQPKHSEGRGRCRHEYGHHSWNNDSYGNSQRASGDLCDCREFRRREQPDSRVP
ncbi:hypothetical protein AB0L33_00295 [Streptomyces sp. NPDC052299]|uniref:hypothetical protein n=1 Tax=Streptomyces sp. NPDC052299 TaxID=3155054 RepID=UPI00341621AD